MWSLLVKMWHDALWICPPLCISKNMKRWRAGPTWGNLGLARQTLENICWTLVSIRIDGSTVRVREFSSENIVRACKRLGERKKVRNRKMNSWVRYKGDWSETRILQINLLNDRAAQTIPKYVIFCSSFYAYFTSCSFLYVLSP